MEYSELVTPCFYLNVTCNTQEVVTVHSFVGLPYFFPATHTQETLADDDQK